VEKEKYGEDTTKDAPKDTTKDATEAQRHREECCIM
jgi:hypothetical protein